MEAMERKTIKLKGGSFPTVSLFLKWYLCRETLEKNKKIQRLLRLVDERKVADQTRWAELLRKRLLAGALPTLGALLERPVNPVELIHLFERVEEFVQLYAAGLKT